MNISLISNVFYYAKFGKYQDYLHHVLMVNY